MVPEWLGPGLFVLLVPMALVYACRIFKKAEDRRFAVAALAVSVLESIALIYLIVTDALF